MTETTTPPVVQDYLAQLDAALVGVADATAHDIRDAIAEELTGLDAATAAVRIEQLGDPFFIAAEAREASRVPAPTEPARPQTFVAEDRTDGVGYVLLASLLVALGGMVIPVLGWAAGIVMVWLSRAWSRAEKWAAVLIPVGAVLVTAASYAIGIAIKQSTSAQGALERVQGGGDGFHGPKIEDFTPVIPAWYDLLWSSALVLILVNFAVGIALLVRAVRRRRLSE
ncbi:hypothetical protein AB4Y63_00645 [Leifsonia sp. YAF41]|uniref:hypothetical protein n=1 Tax=Leifsonia sp. YAF41 TaxID=3233086 RepID=UPI003F9D0A4F